MKRRVLAERSSALVLSTFLLWVITIFLAVSFFCLAINNSLFDSGNLYMTIVFPLIVISTIIYTIWSVNIPLVLVYFSDGMIYLCPKKNKTKIVKPEEIKYISQKNYSGKSWTYNFGILTVHLAEESIKLRWVRDVDEARRFIEEIKDDAKNLYCNK